MSESTTPSEYHSKPLLVFRAVGPAREVVETIRLRILDQGDMTLREMMEMEQQ